jgi:hypothetical protein
MSSRKSIFLPLFLSGVAACVQKVAEGAIAGAGSTLALSIGAYGVVAATSVLAGLLVNRASSAADAAERETLATRNHHLRRGMARALRVALERYRDANKDLPANPYNTLFETWDFVLQLSEADDAELNRFFPIDLTEAQWKATSTYSSNDEEDANAILELLRTLLERDAVYPKWSDDEAIRFAKDLLPYYRQVFADDLAGDGDGFIKNAFDIKSQNELRSLLQKVVPELEKIRRELTIESWALLVQFQPRTDGFSRFVYDQKKDDFVGRDHVVDRLQRGFLSPRKDAPYKFQWHLVVGSAGVGKSRLGFHLSEKASSAWPISGFVEPSAIQHANWFGWMPERPAFLVVDNVLRDSTGVKRLVEALTVADSHNGLAHPVRLLFLERLANVEVVESLFSHCANSRAVQARRFEKEPITLEPLAKDAYLQIARGRDP